MKNCQTLTVGVEKFSLLHNSKVAAASRPTTTGRRPAKTDCTTGDVHVLEKHLADKNHQYQRGENDGKGGSDTSRTAIPPPKPGVVYGSISAVGGRVDADRPGVI